MILPKNWDPKTKYSANAWWLICKRNLTPIYASKGITSCEAQFPGCMKTFGLSFHHRKKRWQYIRTPDELGKFHETILVCAYCHDKIESNYAKMNDDIFKKLRPWNINVNVFLVKSTRI